MPLPFPSPPFDDIKLTESLVAKREGDGAPRSEESNAVYELGAEPWGKKGYITLKRSMRARTAKSEDQTGVIKQ